MIEVIDNFLAEEDFRQIQAEILSPNFPWYKNDFKSHAEYQGLEENYKYDLQMKHSLYSGYNPSSQYISIIEPLIVKINPLSLLRTKVNLTFPTKEIIEYGFHMDYEDERVISAVYYLNTNNGKTVFKTGESVDSVENRLVRFSAPQLHTGTSHTDTKYRALVNLNYIPREQ